MTKLKIEASLKTPGYPTSWRDAFRPVIQFAEANGYQYDWSKEFRTDRGGVTHFIIYGDLKLRDFLEVFEFSEDVKISGDLESGDFRFTLPYFEVCFSTTAKRLAVQEKRRIAVKDYAERQRRKKERDT